MCYIKVIKQKKGKIMEQLVKHGLNKVLQIAIKENNDSLLNQVNFVLQPTSDKMMFLRDSKKTFKNIDSATRVSDLAFFESDTDVQLLIGKKSQEIEKHLKDFITNVEVRRQSQVCLNENARAYDKAFNIANDNDNKQTNSKSL